MQHKDIFKARIVPFDSAIACQVLYIDRQFHLEMDSFTNTALRENSGIAECWVGIVPAPQQACVSLIYDSETGIYRVWIEDAE